MAKKGKKTRSTPKKKETSLKKSKQNKIILGSLLMLLSIALFFSFLSFYFTWQDDQSLLTEFADRNQGAQNLLNKFGASASHFFMYKGFGLASFIFPILLFLTGLTLFLSLKASDLLKKWVWGLVFVIWISIALGFFAAEQPLWGGLVGYEMNDFLQDYTGKIGVFLLLLFGLIIIMVRLFDLSPDKMASYIAEKRKSISADFKSDSESRTDGEATVVDLMDDTDTSSKILDTYTHKDEIPPLAKKEDKTPKDFTITVPKESESVEELEMEVENTVSEEETDVLAQKLVDDFGEFDPTLELGNFKFPPLELLDDHGGAKGITINQKELEQNKNRIVETLRNYKIGIAQIKATIGPTVTLYEIVPEAGVRISKIKNLEDDIA
ncbi:MAG: DNA translocase FtsK 4TM domain-containing protein, partial [Flavobacteriaceae bacterium]